MKSIENINRYAAGLTLVADDIIEFHASRVILLIKICGKRDKRRKTHKIEGLTKLAKLDFFVRYPEFFRRVAKYLNAQDKIGKHEGGIESRMIRFHYGPWDERYYQLLPYLEAKRLITIEKCATTYTFFLSELGEEIADKLSKEPEFASLINNMVDIRKILADLSGSRLKELVYEIFTNEVSDKKLNEIIH